MPQVGLFVKAIFSIPSQEEAYILPQSLLISGNKIPLYKDQVIELVEVDILKLFDAFVYIRSGINESSQVIVSPINSELVGKKSFSCSYKSCFCFSKEHLIFA